MSRRLLVEVVYALPSEPVVLQVEVETGATIRQVVEQSGILNRFPLVDSARMRVGVFGKERRLDDVVAAGDRVEIYRVLINDPKEARRKRAKR